MARTRRSSDQDRKKRPWAMLRQGFRQSDSRGVAVVEMALVLPLFLFLVMGIFDVSNMMRISLGMQHAVRLGVETAASGQGVEDNTRSTTLVEDAVKGYLDILALEEGQEPVVTVRSWEGTDTSGEGVAGDLGGPCDMVEVKVDYTYHPLDPFVAVATLFGGLENLEIPLSRSERRVNEPWASCN
ncbi:MAG: TadE/TadG family type IV pilus assembly protein [Thermodesulfobacteriota bacterium]